MTEVNTCQLYFAIYEFIIIISTIHLTDSVMSDVNQRIRIIAESD